VARLKIFFFFLRLHNLNLRAEVEGVVKVCGFFARSRCMVSSMAVGQQHMAHFTNALSAPSHEAGGQREKAA
jgi:hypothetical protein